MPDEIIYLVYKWIAKYKNHSLYTSYQNSIKTVYDDLQQPCRIMIIHAENISEAVLENPFLSKEFDIQYMDYKKIKYNDLEKFTYIITHDVDLEKLLRPLPTYSIWLCNFSSTNSSHLAWQNYTQPFCVDFLTKLIPICQDLKLLQFYLSIQHWYNGFQIVQKYQDEQNKKYPHQRQERLVQEISRSIDHLKNMEKNINADLKQFFENLLEELKLEKNEIFDVTSSSHHIQHNYFILPFTISSSLNEKDLFALENRSELQKKLPSDQALINFFMNKEIIYLLNQAFHDQINQKLHQMIINKIDQDQKNILHGFTIKLKQICYQYPSLIKHSDTFLPALNHQSQNIKQDFKKTSYTSDFNKFYLKPGFLRDLKDSRMHASSILSLLMIFSILAVVLFGMSRSEVMKFFPILTLGLMTFILIMMYIFKKDLVKQDMLEILQHAKQHVKNTLERHIEALEKQRIEVWKKYFHHLQTSYSEFISQEIENQLIELEKKKKLMSSRSELGSSSGLGSLSAPSWNSLIEKQKLLTETKIKQQLKMAENE